MGLFKFIAGGLAANAASNHLKRPTVTSLDQNKITILGVEPQGVSANRWKVSYYRDNMSNCTHHTTVSRGCREFSIGATRCKVHWPK